MPPLPLKPLCLFTLPSKQFLDFFLSPSSVVRVLAVLCCVLFQFVA